MPRIALISDIHGNLSALQRSIEVLKNESPDFWVCLGDLVGYGPFFNECIEIVRKLNAITVKGNHDSGVTGELTIKHFRNPNRKLIEITAKQIETDHLEWLRKLPLTYSENDWMAVHATPLKPDRWDYIESAFLARNLLSKIETRLCFIGHTHKPAIISDKLGVQKYNDENKFIINPGSIGQSRDGDYRASCAILDTENVQLNFFRIEYSIEENLSALMKKGFSRTDAHYLLRV